MVDVEAVYEELTEPDVPEAGQLLENCVLQALTVHADELPALNDPTTIGVQELVEQQLHSQSPVVGEAGVGVGVGAGVGVGVDATHVLPLSV